jgi:tetratricopeptide (TPR) repeat protein
MGSSPTERHRGDRGFRDRRFRDGGFRRDGGSVRHHHHYYSSFYCPPRWRGTRFSFFFGLGFYPAWYYPPAVIYAPPVYYYPPAVIYAPPVYYYPAVSAVYLAPPIVERTYVVENVYYNTPVYERDVIRETVYEETVVRSDDAAEEAAAYRDPAADPSLAQGVEPPAQPVDIERFLSRGDRAFETGRYAEARDEFARALLGNPNDPRVLLSYGLAEFALGNFVDAASAVERGIEQAPALSGAAFDLRQVYGSEEDLWRHITDLTKYAQQRIDDDPLLILLGFVRFYAGEYSVGLAAFDAYLARYPDDAEVAHFVEGLRRTVPLSLSNE